MLIVTNEEGDELVVDNVLVLGDVDPPGLVVELLLAPAGIELPQLIVNPLVLLGKERLVYGEGGVLVGSKIA